MDKIALNKKIKQFLSHCIKSSWGFIQSAWGRFSVWRFPAAALFLGHWSRILWFGACCVDSDSVWFAICQLSKGLSVLLINQAAWRCVCALFCRCAPPDNLWIARARNLCGNARNVCARSKKLIEWSAVLFIIRTWNIVSAVCGGYYKKSYYKLAI